MVSPLSFYATGDIRHFSVYATIRPLVPELRFGNALSGSSASRTPTLDRQTLRRRSRRDREIFTMAWSIPYDPANPFENLQAN